VGKLSGNVVVVTGAGSGIGRELAVELSKRDCKLALSDINFENLQETQSLLPNQSGDVKLDKLDVSDKEAFRSYVDDVIAHFGHVDRVINNAGRSHADGFLDGSEADFELIMNTNFWSAYHGTKFFLPHLLERPEATIVNVSSINALVPFANQSSYNVSKAAIMSLTESLGMELKGTTVKSMVVIPGGVRTNIVRNSKFVKGAKEGMNQEESAKYFEKIAITSAPRAAKRIVRGIMKNKSRLRVGPDAYLLDYLFRISPGFIKRLVLLLA